MEPVLSGFDLILMHLHLSFGSTDFFALQRLYQG